MHSRVGGRRRLGGSSISTKAATALCVWSPPRVHAVCVEPATRACCVCGARHACMRAAWLVPPPGRYPHIIDGAIAASAPVAAFAAVDGFDPRKFWQVRALGSTPHRGAGALALLVCG